VFLFLPAVASTQFRALHCAVLKDGTSYLIANSAIDCNSESYHRFVAINGCLIAIYQAIPLFYLGILYQHRKRINPHHSFKHPVKAYRKRDNDKSLDLIRFLFKDYKLSRWYFEVVDIYRRIFFTSILPLLFRDNSIVAYFGCILAFLFIIFFREELPYRVEFINFVVVCCQYVIMLVFMAALVLETNSLDSLNMSDFTLGLILLLSNLFVLLSAILGGWFRYLEESRGIISFVRHIKIEWAPDFSKTKFNTTMHVVQERNVSSSQVLVFYYTSLAEAKHMLKDGAIPTTSLNPKLQIKQNVDCELYHHTYGDRGGIVVSTDGPQHLDLGDPSLDLMNPLSATREVVLCLVLPRNQLFPLEMADANEMIDDDHHKTRRAIRHLRILPTEILESMLNVHQLHHGHFISMPTKCVIRAYQLKDDSMLIHNGFLNIFEKRSSRHGHHSDEQQQLNHHYGLKAQTSNNPNTNHDQPASHGSVPQHSNDQNDAHHHHHHHRHGDISDDETYVPPSTLSPTSSHRHHRSSLTNLTFMPHHTKLTVHKLDRLDDYLTRMAAIRVTCSLNGYIPLYHYTSTRNAASIIHSGLQLSTEAGFHGGVYFTVLSPSSYHVESDTYEANLISDFFGDESTEDLVGNGLFDAVVVYGANPSCIESLGTGESLTSRMIGQEYFEDFALPLRDEHYYLRPDHILAIMQIRKPLQFASLNKGGIDISSKQNTFEKTDILRREIDQDLIFLNVLKEVENEKKKNFDSFHSNKHLTNQTIENPSDIYAMSPSFQSFSLHTSKNKSLSSSFRFLLNQQTSYQNDGIDKHDDSLSFSQHRKKLSQLNASRNPKKLIESNMTARSDNNPDDDDDDDDDNSDDSNSNSSNGNSGNTDDGNDIDDDKDEEEIFGLDDRLNQVLDFNSLFWN